MVRLVKGAYWDSEIKRAQERGLAGYPVFTRKVATDVSYLACAKRLLGGGGRVLSAVRHPQRAHGRRDPGTGRRTARDFEFQRLHGMGEALYDEVVGRDKLGRPCRIYAPVGSHEDLLAYLVRRLLENGANTSFVNRIVDEREPIDEIVADPVAGSRACRHKPHPRIPLPRDIFQPARGNSQGIDSPTRAAWPSCGSGARGGGAPAVDRRADRRRRRADRHGGAGLRSRRPPSASVGKVSNAAPDAVAHALERAAAAAPAWDRTPGGDAAPRRSSAPPTCYERHRGRADGADHPRGGQDASRRRCRGARGGRLPALLRGPRARRLRPSGAASRPDRRAQRARAARARRVRLHQRRGISRWRSSPARSPRRWPPATR